MPEILPEHVPSPRTPLVWDGTRYRAVRGHTDGTVQVRGEDQLFSFASRLADSRNAAVSGADGYLDSTPCAAGEVWCVTNVASMDVTTATSQHGHQIRAAAASFHFGEVRAAFAANQWAFWSGWIWLIPTDVIRVYFTGSLAGDDCYIRLTGYIMHLDA